MDNNTNVKPEALSSNDGLSNEKSLNTADVLTKMKIETTSGNEFEMNIKVEANINLENEEQCLYELLESNCKSNATTSNDDFEIDSKICIKEEPILLDTDLPNVEYLDCTNSAARVNMSNECKMESKVDDKIKEFAYDISSKKCFSVDLGMKIKRESFTCSDSDEEIDCQSKVAAVADISQENLNEESDSGTAEDLPSSASPRFTSALVIHDGSSNTIPYACDVKTSSGKNVDKEICSLNYNPACGTQHFETVENIQVYKCKACEKKFSCHLELNRHSCDSQGKKYKCVTCGKFFTYKSSLKAHILLHDRSKAFKCDQCDKCFTRKTVLRKHTLVHNGIKPFKCKQCGKCFIYKSYLKAHTLVHAGSKPFKCKQCDKCFARMSHLRTHTLVHNGIKPFKCEHCDKYFTQKPNLDRHKLVHTGIKPFKCEQCEKCFTRKSDLDAHALVHTGPKPFKCERCGECFTQNSSLQTHTLVHTGSKSFKCEHCGKCFPKNSSLQKHAVVHSGSKPFKCEYCDKCFARKLCLKTHRLVHTGSKPFKCGHCGKCFALKGTLTRHTLIHTDSNSFKCGHCGKRCTLKSNLKRHILQNHINMDTATSISLENQSCSNSQ